MNTFEKLPKWIQAEIVQYTFDTETKVETLTQKQRDKLNLESPAELFESWLIWTGIIGYTCQIQDVHSAIFGPSLTEKSFEAPIILKLYKDANSENFMTRTGFPTVSEAEDFIITWEAAGHSVAWVKC
jgi:hypothetical protein